MEIIILKFSPTSTTKVRLPGRGGREGRGGEGKEEKGRGGGEKGWGVSIWAPPLQNVLLRPC